MSVMARVVCEIGKGCPTPYKLGQDPGGIPYTIFRLTV